MRSRSSPFRNWSNTHRRASCDLPPCIESAEKPSWQSVLAKSSAICFWLTKTKTLWSSELSRAFLTCLSRNPIFCVACCFQFAEGSSTTTTRCSMPSRAWCLALPSPPSGPPSEACPLEIRTGPLLHGSHSPVASSWTALPQVAEKNNTCLFDRMWLEIEVTSPRKPRSSMRSASSKTKYVTFLKDTTPDSTKSKRRPGVATTT
mmetsp:Transcript_37884/g.104165  ORF Transcript_37884/g.104165 Transcript_37884/m.104165 type:complete len:204 (-) Transcript_37884:278-889(-)